MQTYRVKSIPTMPTTNKTKICAKLSPGQLNMVYMILFFLNLPLLFQPRDIRNAYVYRGEKKKSVNSLILPLILILIIEWHYPFGEIEINKSYVAAQEL